MTEQDIKQLYARVTRHIADGSPASAFALIRETAEKSMLWEITDNLNRTERNYRYLIGYLIEGSDDPERRQMLDNITVELYGHLDMLTRRLRVRNDNSLYYSTLRTLGARRISLRQLFESYAEVNPDNAVRNLLDGNAGTDPRRVEELENDIFSHIWVSYPLSTDNAALIDNTMAADNTPLSLRVLIISALMMALQQNYDTRGIELLMREYSRQHSPAVRMAALTALLLTLYKYRDRPLAAGTRSLLDTLRSLPEWADDLGTVSVELIQARNTERVSATMRDTIIPGMMSVKEDLTRKMGEGDLTPEAIEENPEWQELLDKSGLSESLRTLSEMQSRGADIFMATFSHLKQFGFFRQMSNWFLPFSPERSDVAVLNLPVELAGVITSLPFICDSDKYSMALAINMIPAGQHKAMLDQLRAQHDALLDEMAHSAVESQSRQDKREATRNYLRDIYRFFNLFRRKGEFDNPFVPGLSLIAVPALRDDFKDAARLRVIAEFLFSVEFWPEAADAFALLDSVNGPDGAVFEKLGYARHRMRDYSRAVEYYHQAEVFTPGSRWLTARLAEAYESLDNTPQAIRYLLKVAEANPEDTATALRLAHAYLRQHNITDALQQLHKAEYLEPDNAQALRLLVRANILAGKSADASRYSRRLSALPAGAVTADDVFVTGHIAMGDRRYKDAIGEYTKALALSGSGADYLRRVLHNDSELLDALGISPESAALIADAVTYRLDNKD